MNSNTNKSNLLYLLMQFMCIWGEGDENNQPTEANLLADNHQKLLRQGSRDSFRTAHSDATFVSICDDQCENTKDTADLLQSLIELDRKTGELREGFNKLNEDGQAIYLMITGLLLHSQTTASTGACWYNDKIDQIDLKLKQIGIDDINIKQILNSNPTSNFNDQLIIIAKGLYNHEPLKKTINFSLTERILYNALPDDIKQQYFNIKISHRNICDNNQQIISIFKNNISIKAQQLLQTLNNSGLNLNLQITETNQPYLFELIQAFCNLINSFNLEWSREYNPNPKKREGNTIEFWKKYLQDCLDVNTTITFKPINTTI